ncbi:MAG: hypothetical protein ACK40L_18865 [Hydrogenophaga sp.]
MPKNTLLPDLLHTAALARRMRDLSPDQQRLFQLSRLKPDPHGQEAVSLLYTSVRDGLQQSAKVLLAMGVPPGGVGWSEEQARGYLGGDLSVVENLVEPLQVRLAREAAESIPAATRGKAWYADVLAAHQDAGRSATSSPSPSRPPSRTSSGPGHV